MWTRRTFLGGAVATTLLSRIPGSRAATQPGLEVLRQAIALGPRLRAGEMTQLEWQALAEQTLRQCPVEELSRSIRLDRLRRKNPQVKRGAGVLRLSLARKLCTEEGSDMRLFFFKKKRSDPPHCHFNMVTAHIVLEGRFRIRHYDRLREEEDGVVLKASGDRIIGPGEVTSISDLRDNAHWHSAESDGILLDIQQGRLDPALPIRRRQLLDIEGGEALDDGTILARFQSRRAAFLQYG